MATFIALGLFFLFIAVLFLVIRNIARSLLPVAALCALAGRAHAQIPPNDPYYSASQPGLLLTVPERAWTVTGGGGAVVVLMLDTGVNSTHAELAGKVLPGWSTFDNSSNVTDTYSHGTPCSSIVAANTNNATGMAGICWGALIQPIKGTDAFWSSTQIKDALNYAWHNYLPGATRPVSLSVPLASFYLDTQVMAAAGKVYDNGGLLICATGNQGNFQNYPASSEYLMVGGCNLDGTRHGSSNYGPHIDMVAPYAMFAVTAQGGYTNAQGTSFAAPVVAGVAALVLTMRPNLTVDQLSNCLILGCEDVGPAGWDQETGWGVINAEKAIKVAVVTYPP
jgi:thermitase